MHPGYRSYGLLVWHSVTVASCRMTLLWLVFSFTGMKFKEILCPVISFYSNSEILILKNANSCAGSSRTIVHSGFGAILAINKFYYCKRKIQYVNEL